MALQSVVCAEVSTCWVGRSHRGLTVSDGLMWSSRRRQPPSSSKPGSSSRELHLSFRALSSRARPSPLGAERLPWSSVSSSRHRLAESTSGGHPFPAYVPPSTFLTSSTVCSSANLVGLFHPTTTSRIHASGVFPATQPVRLVGEPCPLAVAFRSPATAAPLPMYR